MTQITTLFLDIGGVMMTNGWDRYSREKAIQTFSLDKADFEARHRQFYDTYEQGKTSLDEYLDRTVFYKEQNFSLDDFKKFIFSQSKPYPDIISFLTHMKKEYGLRLIAVSNEGREVAEYRIKLAQLKTFIDDFIISSFVGYQKPDHAIYRIALDIAQVNPKNVIYIDDRKELVLTASKLGIQSYQFTSLLKVRKKLLAALSKS